jgi:tetratricopeptide (TPR) repeat protein
MAPTWLAGLFDDGGAQLLRDGGLGASWREALAHVPPKVLAVTERGGGLAQLSRLRDFWASTNDLQPALAASRALLHLRVQAVGRRHPDTWLELGALGALAMRAGRLDEGGVMLEEAWRGLLAHGERDLRLAVVSSNVAQHLLRRGQLDDAEKALTDAYHLRKLKAPRTAALAAAQLAEIKSRRGMHEDALSLYREAYELTRVQLGDGHPRTLLRAEALGLAYARLERFAQAVPLLRPVHAALAAHPVGARAAHVAFELGLALSRTGVLEEGTRCVESAVRWTREQSTPDGTPHPELPNRLSEWAHLQAQHGRREESEGLLLEALEAERRLHGDTSLQVAQRYLELGRLCARQGRLDEALGWLDPAASLHRTVLGDEDPVARGAVQAQLEVLVQRAVRSLEHGDRAYARDLLDAGLSGAAPVLGFDHPTVRQARKLLEPL